MLWVLKRTFSMADLEPTLRQNYSIFMEKFQKNLEKINNREQLTNRTPNCIFEPPIKKSWICPCAPSTINLKSCSNTQAELSIHCLHMQKGPVSLHTANENMFYEKRDFIGTCKQIQIRGEKLIKIPFH